MTYCDENVPAILYRIAGGSTRFSPNSRYCWAHSRVCLGYLWCSCVYCPKWRYPHCHPDYHGAPRFGSYCLLLLTDRDVPRGMPPTASTCSVPHRRNSTAPFGPCRGGESYVGHFLGGGRARGGGPGITFVVVELLGVPKMRGGWGRPSGDLGDERRSAIIQGGRLATGILVIGEQN
jgi:hypothetical protein